MQMIQYLRLFTDSFLSSWIVPVRAHSVLAAMKIFGGYKVYLVLPIAAAGCALGYVANYLLGLAIVMIAHKVRGPGSMSALLAKMHPALHLPLLLALPCLGPSGSALLIIYGFIRYNLLVFCACVLTSRIIYSAIYWYFL